MANIGVTPQSGVTRELRPDSESERPPKSKTLGLVLPRNTV